MATGMIHKEMQYYTESSSFDGEGFPCSKTPSMQQVCIVVRNRSAGGYYVLWYNNTIDKFVVGTVLAGSAPSTGNNVTLHYPV